MLCHFVSTQYKSYKCQITFTIFFQVTIIHMHVGVWFTKEKQDEKKGVE